MAWCSPCAGLMSTCPTAVCFMDFGYCSVRAFACGMSRLWPHSVCVYIYIYMCVCLWLDGSGPCGQEGAAGELSPDDCKAKGGARREDKGNIRVSLHVTFARCACTLHLNNLLLHGLSDFTRARSIGRLSTMPLYDKVTAVSVHCGE